MSIDNRIKLLEDIETYSNSFLIENGYNKTDISFIKSTACTHNEIYAFKIGSSDPMYQTETYKFASYDYGFKAFIRIQVLESLLNVFNFEEIESDNNFKSKKYTDDGFVQIDFYKPCEYAHDLLTLCVRKAVECYKTSYSFGCCSKYKECLKSGECIHANKLYAKSCSYRKSYSIL